MCIRDRVTPGGGVLKIKLSKRKPVKITTEVPNKRPDLAQTEFKNLPSPSSKPDEQTMLGSHPNTLDENKQSRERVETQLVITPAIMGIGKEKVIRIPVEKESGPSGNHKGNLTRGGLSKSR